MLQKKEKIKVGKLKTVFQGVVYDVQQIPLTFPNGQKGTFEIVHRNPSVSVIAINDTDRILFNREYRPRYKKRLWRFPGGSVEKGETPKMAAQRELREETGFKAKQLSLFHEADMGQSIDWQRYIFLGKDLVLAKLPSDYGEDIKIEFLTLKEALRLVEKGEIQHDLTEYLIYKLSASKKQGL